MLRDNKLTGESKGSNVGLDLGNRCVLLVGGRLHHASHIRSIVENNNGIFIHHDGGMEDNLGRLPGLFNQADVVFFPVGCVSHAAQNKIKQLSRQWGTPYYALRNSGSSGFLRSLDTYASMLTVSTTHPVPAKQGYQPSW